MSKYCNSQHDTHPYIYSADTHRSIGLIFYMCCLLKWYHVQQHGLRAYDKGQSHKCPQSPHHPFSLFEISLLLLPLWILCWGRWVSVGTERGLRRENCGLRGTPERGHSSLGRPTPPLPPKAKREMWRTNTGRIGGVGVGAEPLDSKKKKSTGPEKKKTTYVSGAEGRAR